MIIGSRRGTVKCFSVRHKLIMRKPLTEAFIKLSAHYPTVDGERALSNVNAALSEFLAHVAMLGLRIGRSW